ncbi:exopolysaccharide biosynthesis polyprenyl glycosylphosphotransferase [Bradyrhizobium sp. CCBAU 25338]|uniref:exopolysaccharide biosynthesis polyprenyl glycosylphosphotransferase n=1 Tax=Bradyrhizobium sp. CCBAU 25338 TaxID=1641877 RepID=UPI0023038F2F|nr:exopolysaccharide biosynthesis polyprenyl glycosylphosphotransferase [Bradyrhizobium sp. CCBAU 25338]MDA9526874.1 exopolysaccharide biosynthesis polyprenyl glycosylphosphotransferase [Bradyrhizobium sp. CCBAU 25338]
MNFVNRNIDNRLDAARVSLEPVSPVEQKWPIRYDSIELLALCADIATILFASVISVLWAQDGVLAGDWSSVFGLAIAVSAAFASSLRARGLYRPIELLVLRSQIRAICVAWTSLFLVIWAVGAFKVESGSSRHFGLLFAVLGLSMLLAQRSAIRAVLIKGLGGRKFASTNIVLISDQLPLQHAGLPETLAMHGFCIKGRFSLPPVRSGPSCRKRLSTRVIDCIRSSQIDEIVVEANPERWSDLRAFVADLRVLPFPIMFVPVGAASELLRHPARSLGGAACVELQRGPLTTIERASKRMIDLIGSGLALVVFAPLLAAVAVVIKLDSPGPIFFRQQRCGFNGRIISVRKFRTMHVLEDGPVINQARPSDRRVTRVGKWLRRTSLDELPQLLNVLDGSMSLVGPRPHALAHDGEFDKLVRNYALRRRVRPGLTGWAQVHGCRGPTPTAVMVETRVQYDLWYIDNWSLRLDLAILLRTPVEVLRARNAY